MAAYQHLSHGFDPVFDAQSRVLVLGSFPSALSRASDFYYGNPRNRFWGVLAACANCAVPESVGQKRDFLLSHGIALWDVIEECDIKGSADSSIKNVVPAHVERVLECSRIERIVCNGGVAGRLYKRYLQWKSNMEAQVLPSTSPANAAWSFERLVARWGEALGALPELPRLDGIEVMADPTPSRIDYAVVSTAPLASSYAVHRSMQGNKRRDTKPELIVRNRLREAGLSGYRLDWKAPGHPDIAWPGKRVAVFVNGCYWHRCPHCHPSMPKKNVEYWEAKFARNVQRDASNVARLEADGWRVHVIWECQLGKASAEETFAELLPKLSAELGKPL